MTTQRTQRIRERAYALWKAAGQPEGRSLEFWALAEVEIDHSLPQPPPFTLVDAGKGEAPTEGRTWPSPFTKPLP